MATGKSRWLGRKRLAIAVLSIAVVLSIVLGAGQVSAAVQMKRGPARQACTRALIGGVQFNQTLDQLVADGTITSDQQTAIQDRIEENRADHPRVCAGLALLRDGAIGDAVVELLGVERSEIRQAWMDGESLSEIAAAHGVDREKLIETITNALGVRLDNLVENGRITEEQKAEILAGAQPRIESAVDLHRDDLRDRSAGAQGDPDSSPEAAS